MVEAIQVLYSVQIRRIKVTVYVIEKDNIKPKQYILS